MPEQQHCPLCTKATPPWLTVPGDYYRNVHTPYQLYWCNSCEYGFFSPRPSFSEVADFYILDNYYTHSTSMGAQSPKRSFNQRLREHLAWRFDYGIDLTTSLLTNHIKNERLLVADIGCGSAMILEILQNMGHAVIGFDIDPAARKAAMERKIKVLDYAAENLPVDDFSENFDLIIISHVLEHTIDPMTSLKKAHAITKKGGTIICEVPNNRCSALKSAGIAWKWLDVPRHLNFFTKQSLHTIFQQCGWTPQYYEYWGYYRMFTDERILEEQQIAEFFRHQTLSNDVLSKSIMRNWRLLFRTFLASRNSKYDTIRIIATKS